MQHRPELDRWIVFGVGSEARSVLDVASGIGRNGFLLWEHQVGDFRAGVEIDWEYLQRARQLGVYDGLVRADLGKGLPFATNCVDVVVASAIVVCLAKQAGLNLIAECERVARRGVVLTVQCGDRGAESKWNESQRSVWSAAELRELGYSVQAFGSRLSRYVQGGRRFLYGFYAGTLVAQLLPRFGDDLVCTKALGSTRQSPLPEAGVEAQPSSAW